MADFPDHDHDASLTETRLSGETLHQGSFLHVKRDVVQLPDGKKATREYVQHPGAVMVIPLFDDGHVLLERQYRYPIGRVMIEYPAGKLDDDEGGLTCAQRELQEETGYTAREYQFLTRIHPIISYSTEYIDLYLARGLTPGQPKLDDGEFLDTFIADVPQVIEWIRTGAITDVKTIIGTFWLEKLLSGTWNPGEAERARLPRKEAAPARREQAR